MVAESLRILILEDNPADAELVQFELQEAQLAFTSKVVMTEEDFIRGIQDFFPDLILSDYDLPKYNGALALAEAKRRCPDIPFILVTGAVTEDRAIDILTQGAKDYVLKSRLQQRLAPAVQRALAEAQEHRARKKAESELRETHRTLEERVKIRTAELEAEITARKKVEEEREHLLAEVENRAAELEATIASMATGLIVYNTAGKAIRMNNTARELLPQGIFFSMTVEERARVIRWETEEGQPFPPEEIPVARALHGDTTHGVVIAASFPDHKLWISASAAPIRTSDGRMLGVVASFNDITESKRAEEALRKSENRLQRFYESGLLGVIYWNMNGEIMDANDKFLEMVGYSREDLAANRIDWGHITPPEYRHLDEHSVAELKATGVNKTPFEKEYIRKDGTRIPIIVAGAMLDESRVNGVAFVLDNTERKRAEEALRESEEKYRLIVKYAPAAIYEIDFIENRFKTVNDGACRMLGYTETELLAMSPMDIIDKEGQAKFLDRIRKTQAGETLDEDVEYKGKRKDGSEMWSILHNKFKYSNGQIVGAFVVAHDITERKRAEQEVRQQRELLQVTLSSIGDAVIATDAKGNVTFMNAVAETLTGWQFHEASTKPVTEIFNIINETTRRTVESPVTRVLNEGMVVGLANHTILVRRDGTEFSIGDSGAPIRDADGKTLGVVLVFRDITDRKRVF